MSPESKVIARAVCPILLLALALGWAGVVGAQEGETKAAESKTAHSSYDRAVGYASVAAVMCISCLAAAYAVAKVGAAAMGACAEKPELVGRALIFVAIGEGIAVFGLIVAVLMLRQL